MKRINILSFVIILLVSFMSAQDLTGVKFCFDPGHGGHESDDRNMAYADFWESESNLSKAFQVREIFRNLGATVILTRTGNNDDPPTETSTEDDPSLSERAAIANQNNVDFFHSIHSNGYNGLRNSTLMLYPGPTGEPRINGLSGYPSSPIELTCAEIMVDRIYSANRTTGTQMAGDWTFYGTGQPYLGVFRTLTLPGVLSEGSFHDYYPETWRLKNSEYHRNEAYAFARTYLEIFDSTDFEYSTLAGIVRDENKIADYYYFSGSDDQYVPVNNIVVALNPLGKIYNGDSYNNGYFFFDSLAAGTYELIISAEGYYPDTVSVTIADKFFNFKDDYLNSIAPAKPGYIQALVLNNSSVKIQCEAVANADSYVVYYGTEGTIEPDSVVSDTNEIIVSDLEEFTAYYFQVKVANAAGCSDLNKECYAAVPSADPREVLIVNGFDRNTNTRYDYVKQYVQPLISAGRGFSYILNESVYDGKISLCDYETVIWILGDESTADETFNSVEQDSVETFLKQGGKLFVSGSEIGWDLEAKGSSSDIAFYHYFLKADYIADAPAGVSATYYSAMPITGEIFDGIADFSFDNGTHGTFDVDWPDAINGINGGVNVLKYKNASTSNIAAIRYDGLFPGGTAEGKLVYLAFPFESIYVDSARMEIMAKTFDYFDYVSSIENSEETIAGEYLLFQNYPNPFNPTTTISFAIPMVSNVRLDIYNIRGEFVRSLVNGRFNAGKYSQIWDGKKSTGELVPSGVYILRMLSAGGMQVRNMLLLK